MEKVVLLINNIGVVNVRVDLGSIIVGEYRWKSMTHEPTIKWCADTFGGRCIPKPRKEYKMQ